MPTTKFKSINIDNAIRLCSECSNVGTDIMLLDEAANLPIPLEPRRMDCLFLALCLKGSARYIVDTVEHVVKPGDLIIINRGRVTYDGYMSPDCRGIGMLIDYDFFKESVKSVHELSALFLFARNHPVFSLPEDKVESIRLNFAYMKRKADESDNHFRRKLIESIFLTMAYDICDVIYRVQSRNDAVRTRAEEIFTKFLLLVEANFRDERRVGWYSEQMCISAKYLSETVKTVSQRTPNEWIDAYVVMELRMLLKNTQKSIKEIALELNFANQSFLGKYFKERTGMSPSEYRRS